MIQVYTFTGKLGDMFLALPVISWVYKMTGKKGLLVLADFPYVGRAVNLLLMQECIEDVCLTDRKPEHYNCGGQPYKWTPIQHGCHAHDPYINLGFRHCPDKFVSEFFAEEHGLGVDYDFKLNYGETDSTYKDKSVKIDCWEAPHLNWLNVDSIGPEVNMVKSLQLAAGAKEVNCFMSGAATIMMLARIPVIVYRTEARGDYSIYTTIHGGFEVRHL